MSTKRIIALVCVFSAVASLLWGCGGEKPVISSPSTENTSPVAESSSQEEESSEGKPALENIADFNNIVACYGSTENGRFNLNIDADTVLPDSFDGIGEFRLVISPVSTKEQARDSLKKYLSQDIIDKFWNDSVLKESDGRLYLRDGAMGFISYNAQEARFVELDEQGNYIVEIPQYGSGDNLISLCTFVFAKQADGSFLLNEVK